MRIAVIADIHGNSAALDAVMAEIRAAAPDLTVNLGDCLSGPLDGRGTADRLRALGLPTVAGNHDRWLVDRPLEAMGRWERHVFPQLGADDLAWLRAMPPRIEAEGVLFCHGTPRSDEVFWLDRPRDGRMQLADAGAIEAEATGESAPLILCGHTHVPRVARLADGRLVVNPGSVGSPAYLDPRPPAPCRMEMGAPDARYALVTRTGGRWRAELRHVPYDPAPMVALAHAAGAAGHEVQALLSGRVEG